MIHPESELRAEVEVEAAGLHPGLLDSERRGSWVYYRVVTDALQQLSVLLGADALVTSGR